MKAAAEAKDAASLSSYFNFPALKEILKASLNEKIAFEVAKEKDGNPRTVLVAVLAAAFFNPIVDALLTSKGLVMIIRSEKPKPNKKTETAKTSDSGADISVSYESIAPFVMTVKKKEAADEPYGLVFDRDGLFS